MHDIDIMDRSFEVYHNSEGSRNLFKSSFDGVEEIGKLPTRGVSTIESNNQNEIVEKEPPSKKQKIDAQKVSDTLSSVGSAIGSVAVTVKAFQDPSKQATKQGKKDIKRNLIQVCGRKPLFKKNKAKYDKCVSDYNTKSTMPITSTSSTDTSSENTPPTNKNKMIYIGIGILAVGVIAYFVLKSKKGIKAV